MGLQITSEKQKSTNRRKKHSLFGGMDDQRHWKNDGISQSYDVNTYSVR